MTEYDDVGEFHKKFGLPAFDKGPKEWDEDLLEFRFLFMQEELAEFRMAMMNRDHAGMFDALLDLVYVACGTAHLQGYPWHEGWERVQRANMAKVRAAKDGSDSKRGSAWDVVKPEGWTAPDIEGLLRLYDFDVPEEATASFEGGCPTCRRTWEDINHARRHTAVRGYVYTGRDGKAYCSKLCSGEQ
jgi:predicted HAD superfamily Cof-like phosphohydrolase